MGKGSTRRPLLESREVFEAAWDETFGKKRPTYERYLVDEAAGKDWSSAIGWLPLPPVDNANLSLKFTQKMLADPPTVTNKQLANAKKGILEALRKRMDEKLHRKPQPPPAL